MSGQNVPGSGTSTFAAALGRTGSGLLFHAFLRRPPALSELLCCLVLNERHLAYDSSPMITEEKNRALPPQPAQDRPQRCPTCAAFPKLRNRFLDPRTGRTIRLFECDCGKRR